MSLSKPATGKRKVDDDHRKFIERWEMEYFFMEYRGFPTCLMCKYQLAGVKRVYGNIRRHYSTLHAEECRNVNYIFFLNGSNVTCGPPSAKLFLQWPPSDFSDLSLTPLL